MNKQDMAEAVFAELDVCHDGWITKGELELVDALNQTLPCDIDHSGERVKALFETLDLNGDNVISKEEFLENWESILQHMPQLQHEKFPERLCQLFSYTGPQEAPLYAKGGVSTFFHKPLYGEPGVRPPADCVFFGCPFDAGSTYSL